jgi:polyhydroxyalkanoate synthase
MAEPGQDGTATAEGVEAVAGGEAVTQAGAGRVLAAILATLGHGQVVSHESLRLAVELARVAFGTVVARTGAGRPTLRRSSMGRQPAVSSLGAVVSGGHRRAAASDRRRRRRHGEPEDSGDRPIRWRPVEQRSCAYQLFSDEPDGCQAGFDTGGRSVLRGTQQLLDDLRHNGAFPEMVDRSGFEVGRNLAVSPGAVIERDEVAEVLQYSPTAETVFERPVLVVPPPIGRYYFVDLAPTRSFVEYATSSGAQVFMLSWRNPTREQAGWDLDTDAGRVSTAIDTVREVAGSADVNLMAFCAGGIISTGLLSHMAADRDSRVNSMSYAVTLLDYGERAPIAAYGNRGLLAFARRRSLQSGTITSRQMGSAFTLMRPDDLLFNYVVNNYLLGQRPPAFDILAWNADGTNLPGALHGQFLDIFRDNPLVRPDSMSVLGTPVDVSSIRVPVFVTGAISDHLTPWRGCYRTTQMVGGDNTFVLRYSGHIASLVNPPGNPKAHYWVGRPPGPDPDKWLESAEQRQGSWWEPWSDWVAPLSGNRRPAPGQLGSHAHPPLDAAPGSYARPHSLNESH